MYLKIRSVGQDAGMISHLLAKNPHNLYDRDEKGARVRIVYPVFTEQELEVLLFVTPDPVELVKGTPDSYDITQYINDREFAVSSLFCSYLRSALGTALNGKPKADYAEWVQHPFPMEVSFGPVASNLPDDVMTLLFTSLGYDVRLERPETSYSFKLKERSTIRAVHLTGRTTLQQLLRQLFVLMPVLDDYKHYYIGEEEVEKLHRYGEGWLLEHPQHAFIARRSLRFASLLRLYRQGLPEEVAQDFDTRGRFVRATDEDADSQLDNGTAEQAMNETEASPSNLLDGSINEIAKSENTVESEEVAEAASEPAQKTAKAPRLNELRYEAIVACVGELESHRRVVDFGAGEGKLSERLASIAGVEQVWAVEPSAYAGVRALDRFAAMEEKGANVVPQLATGSLFYRDERWSRHDVMILCEVIEHINEARLPMVMRTLFNDYQPQTLIMTTPNREYNAIYELDEQRMRHADHRFEWTRAEFQTFCQQWSEYGGYQVTFEGIGERSDEYGQPTQMAIFQRIGGDRG
ncbi:methyltransferase domain-containing protein [Paenibacillus hunanensis]|uniref:methyltransferase domain-containing protein n=1 Tax=Paenibacillus hunanensis TaxID=539262 RepID=UPI002026E5D7|nr:methyltransferase domain-containing protein [Paenibacillus hunanensis]MCL9659618.1 methyltransferase domain-containing protein [Paenibacillus hunanensis]